MRNYIEYEYFTLDDLVGDDYITTGDVIRNLQEVYEDIMDTQAPRFELEVENLWAQYIMPTYFDSYVFRIDITGAYNYDDRHAKINRASSKWILQFVALINTTKNKYIPLIKEFEANSAKLMDKISTKSTARFNDTPQIEGDLSGVEFTTNITVSENESDGATVAVRLAEVKAAWENIYYQWMREFHGLFIEA